MATATEFPSLIFRRFVEAGRLCFIQYGADNGKVAVIADIVDQRRVLIDGPTTDVPRQSIPIKRIKLTDPVLKIARGATSREISEALKSQDVVQEWKSSAEGKTHLSMLARENLTDFERFKIRRIRKQRAYEIKKALTAKGITRSKFGLKTVTRRVSPKSQPTTARC